MRLFRCHAVMPLFGHQRRHVVRTYVVIASTWEEARARIRGQEPGAEFVTVPVEIPNALMVDVTSMSERELADLRFACTWNEARIGTGQGVRQGASEADARRE